MAASDFQVVGKNSNAPFTLKLHRGDGMCLVAMNWKVGKPPEDFVGFAIESKPPGGDSFFPLNNRIAFSKADGTVNPFQMSTLISPIQKFRWVHFPRNANLEGEFEYRVTPIFIYHTRTRRRRTFTARSSVRCRSASALQQSRIALCQVTERAI